MQKTDFCLLFYRIFVNMNILLHLATGILANLWKFRPMQTVARDLAQSLSTLSRAFKREWVRMKCTTNCQILNSDSTTVARLNKASATVSSWSLNNRGKNWLKKYNCLVILMSSVTVLRGEERFREEGETAKKDREEGERKQKKQGDGRMLLKKMWRDV